MEKISACITCGNEEKNIRRCLESVQWADEVVVVDSFSTDNTLAICKEYTDRVYQQEWLGYIGQKNHIKNLAEGPWILFVDADEEVSTELRDEILNEFKSGSHKEMNGYDFPRIVKFMGKWIRHGDWYPDTKLRLFRKDIGRCEGVEPHDRVHIEGPVKRLHGHLHHFTYDDITDMIDTLNRFSTIAADGAAKINRMPRWSDLYFRPFYRFIKCFIVKHGFRDGFIGFIIAVTSAYGTFIKYAKLREHYFRNPPEK